MDLNHSLDSQAMDRLEEFQKATDQELAEAVRLAVEMPRRAMSRSEVDKLSRLLETITFLIRK